MVLRHDFHSDTHTAVKLYFRFIILSTNYLRILPPELLNEGATFDSNGVSVLLTPAGNRHGSCRFCLVYLADLSF